MFHLRCLCRVLIIYPLVSISITLILHIQIVWFIAHDFETLHLTYSIESFRLGPVDVIDKVSDSACHSGHLRLWRASLDVPDPHDPAWLGWHLIFRVQRVHCPFSLPLVRVDVLIVELEVRALPRHILFEVTRLCPFDTVSVQVVRAPLYIPQCPVHIRFNFGHVADV